MFPPTPTRDRATPRPAAMSAERLKAAAEERATASYLSELLESPAWRDVLAPSLEAQRELYSEQLVAATLGFPILPTPEAEALPPVVLAARCSAIDWLTEFISAALRRGAAADARIARELSELPSTSAHSVI